MNEQDNLVEYSDPEIYDLENSDFEPDGPFILALAQKLGGAVLELGCGTGRMTIPLAQNGVEVVGLDIVHGMIERARQKSGELPIEWILADVRTFQLSRKFRLIFESGSVFRHMLTRSDQEAYLERVREHLEDNGRLVINLLFPRPNDLMNTEGETDWYTEQHPDGYEIRVSGIDKYDALRQVKTETAYRRWTDAHGQEIVKVAPLSLRFIFPQEMEALLHYNGFEVVERYGDVDLSPLTNDSRFLVYICRKGKL
jgi:ubiquinone/menaquinone biosynthesis C-methylase UbiE